MTDYYTQFAATLVTDSEEEAEWVGSLCTCFHALACENTTLEGDHFNENGKPITRMSELAVDLHKQDGFASFCDWEVDGDTVYFTCEDSGEPHAVALVVQAYFRHFKKSLTTCFSMEWAHTCSKRREDAFGGGALVVNCETIRAMGTADWVHEQLTKLGALQEKAGPG